MAQPNRTPIAQTWATSDQAPVWIAVCLYAAAMADPATGTAHLRAGQLREAVAPGSNAPQISQAIRRAVRAGWLHPDSTAWCLRLARPAGGPDA